MGRGDKKSKKGKIRKGSYGNSRLRKANKKVSTPAAATAEVKAKPKAKKVAKKKVKAADKE